MAILSKFLDQEALVIDELRLAEAKTKPMAAILKALKLDGATCLVGTAAHEPVIYKSARNIRGVEVAPASQLNAYTVLKQKRLLLTRAALEELRKLGKTRASKPEKTEPSSKE
jgi:large subunit ribosomal protein L4